MHTVCKNCRQNFEVVAEDLKFYEKVSPIFGEKKYPMPAPKLCPDCRQQRRLSFRNERNLYNRACDLCKKPIITIYSPDKQYTIYCRECWWSDKWDPLSFGKDFDFKRPFFEQYQELLKIVPKAAIIMYNCENCDFTNYQNDARNCYLTFGSGVMEDCSYCNWCYHAKNIVDCSFCTKAELDYMNVDCFQTYHCEYCQDCKVINDCSYCFDCRSCQNCFGCVGLRKKKFHIFNKAYPQAEYEKLVQELRKPQNRAHVLEQIKKLKMGYPHLASRITNSENCTGDDIENSKNCHACYGVKDGFDCKYCYDILGAVFGMKDVYDASCTGDNELTYEIVAGGYYKYSAFIYGSAHLNFTYYAVESNYGSNIFGGVGLKSKKYVILNKQYTQEEYEALVPKIIEHMMKTGEWGEFFPATLSAFGYNETLAYEYFPLKKEEALAKGFQWSDYEIPTPVVKTVLKASQVPADIKAVTDDILNTPIECEVTGKPFKITKQELDFYRKNNIALPTRHPNQRYRDRIALRNPRTLFDRNCSKCAAPVRSVYAPTRPEIIYCEKCYLAAIY